MELEKCIHEHYCPDGARCTTKVNDRIGRIETLSLSKLKHGSQVLFHGTFTGNTESILEKGLLPEECADPSFGHGVYLTPCLKYAMDYADGGGVVFMCHVRTQGIETVSYEDWDEESTSNAKSSNGLEYVICSREDIEIVAVIYLKE